MSSVLNNESIAIISEDIISIVVVSFTWIHLVSISTLFL
jgi:hypothetical protein